MPTHVITVNPDSDQSKQLVEQIAKMSSSELVFDKNAATVEEAKSVFAESKPEFVVIASSYTPEEKSEVTAAAKAANPSVHIMDIPHGLQKEKGIAGVMQFALQELPKYSS